MKRTQVLLDDATYRALKRKAFERSIPMSALVRELLHEQLNPVPAHRSLESFRFLGSGPEQAGRYGAAL